MLSKVNYGTNQVIFLEMHMIKYMLDTRNLGLKLETLGMKKNPGTSMF